MINIYNIYSEDIFDDKYAVFKLVLRSAFKASIVNIKLIFEYQFCTIMDLYCEEMDNKHSTFIDINDYKDFLLNALEDYEINGPDKMLFGGYAQKLDQIELEFFMKNYPKKQAGYLYPKIYNFKTREELPAYYILLSDYSEYYADIINQTYKGLEIPKTKEEIESLLFENQYNWLVSRYEKDEILNFDYPFVLVYNDMQKMVVNYLKSQEFDIKEYQKIYEGINEIEDPGVAKFLLYTLNSFSHELENKKLYKMCKNCEKLFEYKDTKKYCSDECKIKAKNKRYYKKNAAKIKIKNIK